MINAKKPSYLRKGTRAAGNNDLEIEEGLSDHLETAEDFLASPEEHESAVSEDLPMVLNKLHEGNEDPAIERVYAVSTEERSSGDSAATKTPKAPDAHDAQQKAAHIQQEVARVLALVNDLVKQANLIMAEMASSGAHE